MVNKGKASIEYSNDKVMSIDDKENMEQKGKEDVPSTIDSGQSQENVNLSSSDQKENDNKKYESNDSIFTKNGSGIKTSEATEMFQEVK